ncbi:hypothetical protein [Nonomuraea insulae]|uniref:DUF2157 domain-containing protein n=1 Tax=Nonomuraea insulae TaxID=1616787 RepID=A0ABW1CJ33_9ACTN
MSAGDGVSPADGPSLTDGVSLTEGPSLVDGVSLLERRYRSVLRLLPASYRAGREEEMVDAFMESSGEAPDEVNPRPSAGEVASALALSLRVRLGGASATPRYFAWGEAVRLVALLGLAYQSLNAVQLILSWVGALVFGAEFVPIGAPGSFVRLVYIGNMGATVCWAVAFMAIMRGRVRLAKVTALIGAVPTVAYFLVPMVLAGPRPLTEAADLMFTVVPVIALLLGFHSDVTPWRRSWRLTLSVVAAGLAAVGCDRLVIALEPQGSDWLYLWLHLGLAVLVWAAASVAVLAGRHSASWSLALAGAGSLLLLARLPELESLPEGAMWGTACAQCVLLGALSVMLAVVGLRALPNPVRERSG